MTIAAVTMAIFSTLLFGVPGLLIFAGVLLVLALAGLYVQHRINGSNSFIDWALQLDEPGQSSGRVIADPSHPLWCRAGARRGPEQPADLPDHTATGRFR